MSADDRDRIRELLAEGVPPDQIANELGVSRGTVAAIRAHITMGTYGGRQPSGSRGGAIYLRRGADLIALSETPYATEDVLQRLLADYPGLLAGDEIGDAPRRWVLLDREVGIADDSGATGRWSLDHLFIDQDGVPTLVEVKRSSDTRIRREVVGQLLEYAANGPRHWPVEQLRALFEANCESRDVEPTDALHEALGEDVDADTWWTQVETNLRQGRLRLVFVADSISRELRRIIEFLNEQMTQTEVIGVEIRQYVDADGEHQTLVPRLVGQTEAARDAKVRPKPKWDRDKFMAALVAERPEAPPIAERLFEWAHQRGVRVSFGGGANDPRAQFDAGVADSRLRFLAVFAGGPTPLQVRFGVLAEFAPFDTADARRDLKTRLERLPGVSIPENRLSRWPSFDILALAEEADLRHFIASMDWVLDSVKRAAQTLA